MSREMKYSGIPWIGDIPKDWEYARYKYSGMFVKGKLPNEQHNEPRGCPIIGASEMLGKECRNFSYDRSVPMCLKYDILILWDGANAGIIANGHDGIVSSTVVMYQCKDTDFDAYYLYYLFKNGEPFFKSKVEGTTIPHMNQRYIDEYLCVKPNRREQENIAYFLDKKCAEVDEMVALQEKMIEELKAYKQSVITEAVTKGLNPNAPMKDSGIEWIGEIPEHWEVCRIKNSAELFGRIGFRGYKSEDLNKDGDGAITLSPSNMSTMSMDYSNVTYLNWEKYHESPEIKIQNGDILMVKTGSSYGKVSYVENLPKEATINPQILRIVSKINSKYFAYILQTELFRYQVEVSVVGGTIPTISQEKINNFFIPISSDIEQQQIANYLDDKCSAIDNLISIKQQKIEELKDYKKSIIYEYVTGKKEVEE